MDQIKDIINTIVAHLAGNRQNVQRVWQKIVHEPAEHTAVSGLKGGCLYVVVDSPARLFRFNFKKNQFLKELTKEIPEINNIVFRVGKL